MGREVRRVPAGWEHPRDAGGEYVPLFDGWKLERDLGSYAVALQAWMTEDGGAYELRYGDYMFASMMAVKRRGTTFRDWQGPEPDPRDYMPRWQDCERTCYQYYESTTEGTPLSPVFKTIAELGDWLDGHESESGCVTIHNGRAWARANISGERPWDR